MSDDNPSAFPQADRFSPQGEPGMSLRDWFAGQALAGLMVRSWDDADGVTPPDIFDLWARAAYRTADAMLAEGGRKA